LRVDFSSGQLSWSLAYATSLQGEHSCTAMCRIGLRVPSTRAFWFSRFWLLLLSARILCYLSHGFNFVSWSCHPARPYRLRGRGAKNGCVRSFGRNKRDASNAVASGAGPSLFTTAHACLPGTAGGRFCAQVDGLSMVALVLVWRRADGVGGGGAHTTTGTSLSTPPGQEGCNRIFRPVDRRIQACSSEWVVVLMTCGSELDVVGFISDC